MTQEFKLPDLGEGIHEAEIVTVKVQVGDAVQEGDIIFEVETDKAVVEIPSPFTGTVSAIPVQAGDRITVGTVLITFDGPPAAQARASAVPPVAVTAAAKTPPAPSPAGQPVAKGTIVPASPATRRLARELDVALDQVTPTGSGGVVTAEDVKAFAAARSAAPPPSTSTAATTPVVTSPPLPADDQLPDFAQWGSVQRVAMRAVRRATARQTALAWSRIPHVNSQDAIDITSLESFRQNHKEKVAQKGGKLSLTVFVIKAVAAALKQFPNFNASLDSATDELILKQYYHIGVAVDTPDGLIVPVVRDVERKSIVELAIELNQLVQRTRARQIKVEELRGGTFTITNAGAMGGGFFSPIINYPEVAILGLGQARWQPVVEQMEPRREPRITARLLLPLILAIDHRVLDGADSIRFLAMIKQALEDPEELLLTML